MGKNEKKNLSETTWHRALIFGMKHHLVDLYQLFQTTVMLHIKGNGAYNHMLANSLHLHTLLTPRVVSRTFRDLIMFLSLII